MRILRYVLLALVVVSPLRADETSDLAAARAVFEKNIDAIRHQDRAAYMSLYLQSDRLVRGGPEGFTTGYDDFAKMRGPWPDTIDASDVHLVQVAPGFVYGTYRYRVRYGNDEHTGISERLFVKTDAGWKVALTGAVDAPPGTPPPPRAIEGATLIDGRGGPPVANANVVIRDGKIDCAGPQCAIPEGVEVIHANGMFVTPGLVDAHVHFSQTGWADGRPDFLDVRARYPYDAVEAGLEANPQRFAKSYVCSGVTSVFDVGGFTWTLRLADRFRNDTLAPHIAAAGPLLSPFVPEQLALPAEQQFIALKDEAAARAGVDYNAAKGAKAIKIWYIVRPPDLTVAASEKAVMAAGDEATKKGLPLITHTTGLAEAKVALRAGAKVLVHSVEDLPVDDEFLALAKRNGTIDIPTLTVVPDVVKLYEASAAKKAPAVDDPNHCVDRATMAKVAESATVDVPADRIARMTKRATDTGAVARANLRTLIANGIPIATGTDAGNPLTLHGPAIYAEMDAMQSAGMTPMQVIVASTATASRAAGLDAVTGTIEKGKDADLLILAADPSRDVANFRRIRFVVRGGVVRGIEELSAMAQ